MLAPRACVIWAAVFRTWLCILALLFAPASGFGFMPAVSSGDACVQSCPDDDARGQCAPDCQDCACCAHVHPVVVLARAHVVVQWSAGAPRIAHDERQPPSADVGDILHVPIVPLA